MLGTWMFFWNWSGGGAAPADPQPEAERTSRGSGGKYLDREDAYAPLGDDYWMMREHLMRPKQDIAEAVAEDAEDHLEEAAVHDTNARNVQNQINDLSTQLEAAVQAAQSHPDPQQRRAAAAIAMKLSIDISNLREQYIVRAKSVLSLDLS